MKKWIGKSFKKWCESDVKDERKINYTLHKNGLKPETFIFTSEEKQDGWMLHRLRNSIIDKIELINNEWYVELTVY